MSEEKARDLLDESLVSTLRLSKDPVELYAASRIERLESQVKKYEYVIKWKLELLKDTTGRDCFCTPEHRSCWSCVANDALKGKIIKTHNL